MISYIIYLLTIFNILKWKKRFKYEIFQITYDNYSCQFFNFKIRICQFMSVFPQMQSIDIIYKNKIYRFNEHKIINKILKYLNNKNLQRYINEDNLMSYTDIKVKRKVKLMLLRKELIII